MDIASKPPHGLARACCTKFHQGQRKRWPIYCGDHGRVKESLRVAYMGRTNTQCMYLPITITIQEVLPCFLIYCATLYKCFSYLMRLQQSNELIEIIAKLNFQILVVSKRNLQILIVPRHCHDVRIYSMCDVEWKLNLVFVDQNLKEERRFGQGIGGVHMQD